MATSSQYNLHKQMSGADGSKGNFGVSPYPGRSDKPHPDVGMSHEPMHDSVRSAAHKGMMGASDHGIGKGAQDHHVRAGKA